MRVKCCYVEMDQMPQELRSSILNIDRIRAIGAHRPPITLDKIYTVYGVHVAEGNVWYEIIGDDEVPIPISVHASMFRIIDERPSRTWVCRSNERGSFFLWPPSWFQEFYHDRLGDGDTEIVTDFERVKREIDGE